MPARAIRIVNKTGVTADTVILDADGEPIEGLLVEKIVIAANGEFVRAELTVVAAEVDLVAQSEGH